MTNTISVPRDLLERIVGKCKLSVLGDDHAKVWELLAAAPKAEPQPVSDAYRMAVDTGLVCAHIGVTDPEDDYETARKKLNDLICWSVQVDRDLGQPSDDARDALVEALEDAIDYLNEPLNSIQHGSILYSQMCEALSAYRAAIGSKGDE